jgi:type IV pilus assembly protein PilY1
VKGEVIGAYAGDLQGNVWRFDLTGVNSSSWQNGQLLFNAQTPTAPIKAQPITAAPGVFARNDGKTGYIVVVGTGKILTNTDVDMSLAQDTQSAYGLWDKADFGSNATFTGITGRSLLINSTSSVNANTSTGGVDFYTVSTTTPIDWATHRGWSLDYTLLNGQRSVYPIDPLYSLVRIDTIAPKANQTACSITGEIKAVNYLIDPFSGVCKTSPTIDINGDNQVNAADGNSCVYTGLGDGTNAPLETGDGKVHIVGATDHRLIDPNGPPPPCLNPTNNPCLCLPLGTPVPYSCGDPLVNLNKARNVRQIFVRP